MVKIAVCCNGFEIKKRGRSRNPQVIFAHISWSAKRVMCIFRMIALTVSIYTNVRRQQNVAYVYHPDKVQKCFQTS